MQHTNSPQDAELDARVRDALDSGIDLHDSAERSRYETAFRLDDAIADEVRATRPVRRPARSRRPVLAIVGGLAAAVLVAGALAPGFDATDGDGGGTAPFVAGDASAAEVLERAAERMLASGSDVGGSGPTWYSSSTSRDGGRWETWYDPSKGVARWATYQPSGVMATPGPGASQGMKASYYVLEVDAAGAGTIRQYYRVGAGEWSPQPGGSQMDSAGGDSYGLLVGSVETEALAWLRAVDAADTNAELRAANERFVERTHMWFSPPTAGSQRLGEDTAASRAMQALYLLRIARLEPDAVAQLYRDVLDLDALERLEDGTLDGETVLRLRLFDPPTGEGGDTLASVLLLDAATGEPLGVESTTGSVRERFAAPTRTAAVGSDPATCGDDPLPPCELLRGDGPIAGQADAIAKRFAQPLDPTPGDIELDGNEVVAAEVVKGGDVTRADIDAAVARSEATRDTSGPAAAPVGQVSESSPGARASKRAIRAGSAPRPSARRT